MGWVVSTTPWPIYPRNEPVPIVQEAGWAPGSVWTVVKISLQPGFDPQTVHPVASRYTDCTKPEGKRAIGRHMHRRDDNIRIGVQEIGLWGVEWIEVAQEEWTSGGVLWTR